MPLLNHEVGHLIQEAYDIVVQFLGWLGVLLVLLDQAYEALQSGIGRILGIFTQCLNESPLAGQTDLMVELALFLEQICPLPLLIHLRTVISDTPKITASSVGSVLPFR